MKSKQIIENLKQSISFVSPEEMENNSIGVFLKCGFVKEVYELLESQDRQIKDIKKEVDRYLDLWIHSGPEGYD